MKTTYCIKDDRLFFWTAHKLYDSFFINPSSSPFYFWLPTHLAYLIPTRLPSYLTLPGALCCHLDAALWRSLWVAPHGVLHKAAGRATYVALAASTRDSIPIVKRLLSINTYKKIRECQFIASTNRKIHQNGSFQVLLSWQN